MYIVVLKTEVGGSMSLGIFIPTFVSIWCDNPEDHNINLEQ
jgi:hypothetical protein